MAINNFMFLLAFLGPNLSNQNVCLKVEKHEKLDNKYKLICRMDKISLNVEFLGPDGNSYGSCFAPAPNSQPIIDCGDNITQYLDTGETILLLDDSKSNIGKWTCKYGTGVASDSEIFDPKTCNFKTTGVTTACICTHSTVCWVLSSIVVVISVSIAVYRMLNKRKDNRLKENYMPLPVGEPTTTDTLPSYSDDKTVSVKLRDGLCQTCEKETSFAFCDTCGRFYCETCSHDHEKKYASHHIIQTEQFPMKRTNPILCKKCKANEVIKVCKGCEHMLCERCECDVDDKHHAIKRIIIESSAFLKCREPSLNMPEGRTEFVSRITISKDEKLKEDEHFKRICTVGLACIVNGHLILADYNNWQLLVVRIVDKRIVSFINLRMEPRGMTEYGETKVAVTFAYEKQIRIFEFQRNKLSELNEETLNMKTIGKPFSISYSYRHFAVEIGERKNGFIAVINTKGEVLHRVHNHNNKFGYFTGNTIRLALDMLNEVVFITAIGKKAVYCVDIKQCNIEFFSRVPSPREVIVLPSAKNDVRILFASNRGCAIHQVKHRLSETKGHEVIPDIILTGENNIKLPECISFCEKDCMLYVGEDNGDVNIYRFYLE